MNHCDVCEEIRLEDGHYVQDEGIQCFMCGKLWRYDE
jgi:hypothetical protein